MTGDEAGMGPKRDPRRIVKRALDIVGSLVGLLLTAPVMALVALAIVATMGRPVLFSQRRPGYRERIFTLRKFRTMRAPKAGEVWFRTDEARLTRLGRFLRRSSLDELPTFWNVLRGDMSLVGPRPLLVEYLERYTPRQRRRHDVPPGLTGLAQVNGRQEISFGRRLDYDVWYVENWSLGLDARILLRTLLAVVARRGVLPGQNVDEVDDVGLTPDNDD